MSTAPERPAPPEAAAPGPPHRGPGQISALDGVRGTAILAVVAFHTTVMATRDAAWIGETAPPLALWPLFAGKLGVDVFFVLSGFLVLRSWLDARSRLPHQEAVQSFARRRARRILPAYWFSLLVFIPLRVPGWLTSFGGLADIIAFVSMQQFLDPDLPHHVNVVTWSLTTEVHFYVLLPALAWAFVRFGWQRVLPLLIAATIVWRVFYAGTGQEAEWICGRIDQFAAGMVAATLVADRRRWTRALSVLRARVVGPVLLAASAAVAVPLGARQLLPKPLAFEATFHALAGIVIAVWIVRGACDGFSRIFGNRALRGLGDASYSLYLWHWPLLMEATVRYGNGPGVIAAALGVTAACSALSYVVFERPFIKARRTEGLPAAAAAASEPGRRVEAHR
jgi:peptidoglycan/LPS O-acetylase OafA/YrhL